MFTSDMRAANITTGANAQCAPQVLGQRALLAKPPRVQCGESTRVLRLEAHKQRVSLGVVQPPKQRRRAIVEHARVGGGGDAPLGRAEKGGHRARHAKVGVRAAAKGALVPAREAHRPVLCALAAGPGDVRWRWRWGEDQERYGDDKFYALISNIYRKCPLEPGFVFGFVDTNGCAMHAIAGAAIDSSVCSMPETENRVAKIVPIDD